MKLKSLLLAATLGFTMMGGNAFAQVDYEHVRNATGKVSYNDTTFLIDPMLAEKGRYPGFEGTFNSEIANPTVELPYTKDDVMKGVDAVIVSHTHLDHWDDVAKEFIKKDMPIFAQNEDDAVAIRQAGFTDVRVLTDGTEFGGVTLYNIHGTHGTQEMYDNTMVGKLLGESMGIVFTAPNEKTTYILGDTIWTPTVSKTLHRYNPDVLIMNTGYAKLLQFNDSIIMGTEDVAKAANMMPNAKIVAVHMDAVNHMTVSRKHMRDFVRQNQLESQVIVPEDGEKVSFANK